MGIDDIIKKAKEEATDERVDQAAGLLKKVAPDHVDEKIDTYADKAKDLNA
jgi:hypothetical protein